ncbi:TerB family tellurite resistance protein [Oceaniglobus ichthyenteri]|uniref:tellurite resistance TerB family protein n=1 Tax=Oceaniglobus ichthyenteri TaxID=2136177 RepID=UPI000D3DA837|nr:TerB family tellurite resistance protein [Oceaniglobus ichthyenteri]
MFKEFLTRLTAPEPDTLSDPDARLALAALLVRIARADDDYSDVEIAKIDRVLCKRYALSPFEAAALRREAESLESEAPDTVRFTRAIKNAVAFEDRVQVVEALWEIVLADGVRDEDEDALLRLIAPMLGLNDRDSNLARQRVEARQP